MVEDIQNDAEDEISSFISPRQAGRRRRARAEDRERFVLSQFFVVEQRVTDEKDNIGRQMKEPSVAKSE